MIFGKRSWVGYRITENPEQHKLPEIRKGILNPTEIFKDKSISHDTIDRLNLLYTRDYKVLNDLNIISEVLVNWEGTEAIFDVRILIYDLRNT